MCAPSSLRDLPVSMLGEFFYQLAALIIISYVGWYVGQVQSFNIVVHVSSFVVTLWFVIRVTLIHCTCNVLIVYKTDEKGIHQFRTRSGNSPDLDEHLFLNKHNIVCGNLVRQTVFQACLCNLWAGLFPHLTEKLII